MSMSFDQLKLLADCARAIKDELLLEESKRCVAVSSRFGEHIVEWLDDAIVAAETSADIQEQQAYDLEMGRHADREMRRHERDEAIRLELYGTPGNPK